MNRTPIFKLLFVFIICGLYACQDTLYTEDDRCESKILKTKSVDVWDIESLIAFAKQNYSIQFVNIPEKYNNISTPLWDDFIVEFDNDTCTIISIPIISTNEKYKSDFFIVRKFEKVDYYIRLFPQNNISFLGDTIKKMNVSLYVLSSDEVLLYDGYVKNNRFEKKVIRNKK